MIKPQKPVSSVRPPLVNFTQGDYGYVLESQMYQRRAGHYPTLEELDRI